MRFRKIILPNGLRLVLVPRPQSLAASVLILVEAGTEYEKKNINGLSHFLEHMTFKGTAKRPRPGQIAEELASLGARTNAFTSYEYTGYWAKAEHRKLPKILEVVSDLYLNPLFNPEEIEKERGVIIEEKNMYEDNPAHKVQDVFIKLMYGDQPAGWDVVGEKSVIKRLERDDFLRYRAEHYTAPKTAVIVAGRFEEKSAAKQVRGLFGGLGEGLGGKRTRTKEGQSGPRSAIRFKKSDQSHIILGLRVFDIFDRRRHALHVLSDILGGGMSSRLFHKVRNELGAAYYIYSSPDLYLDHGYLAVAAGVDHGKINEVIKAILEEFARLKKELVPEKELQRSKDHLIGNMVLDLETSDSLAGFYGRQEILTKKILPPSDFIDKIKAIKAEEIRNVVRAIAKDSKLNLAVVGPYKNAAVFRKILAF